MKDKYTYRHLDASGELPEAWCVNPYTVPTGYFENLNQQLLRRCRDFEDAKGSLLVPSNYFDQLQDSIFVKIAEQKLKDMVVEPGFSVPEGFFDHLEKSVLERCTYADIHLSLAMDTPPGYFQQLEETIITRVQEQELREKVGESGFAVPEHYFDTLQQHVIERAVVRTTVPIRKMGRPKWMAYAAVACVALALSVVGFFRLTDGDQVAAANDLAAVSDQEILSYLELYGSVNDIVYISEHIDDFGERNIGEGLSEEDIEAYLNNTL